MSPMRSYDFAELVTRQVESDELDYKSAMSWRTMTRQEKGKIVRHLTAFANTGGGFLVIGVGEDASGVPGVYTGVSEEQAGSFDPTPVGNFINAHIEPPLDYTIERPMVNGKRYVIFVVRPFKNLPHVCSKGVEGELQEGIFYIRTAEASSRPARRAHELQELIRRCMRNEREQLGRILRGILYESRLGDTVESGQQNDMLLDAERYFRRRKVHSKSGALVKFSIIPATSLMLPGNPAELSSLISASVYSCSNPRFLSRSEAANGKKASNSLRFLAPDKPLMWQFFDHGLFCCFRYLDPAELTSEDLARFCAEATAFAGNLGKLLNLGEELLTLQLVFSPAGEMVIDQQYHSSVKEISAEIRRSAADLASGRENHAARLLRRIGEQFQLPDKNIDRFDNAIRTFLESR
ncbi:MAG: ATP-binding protein [Lentisphaerae bacterium]|nr:ATP-binding protein [Lentisphaerota bacterium]